LTKTGSPFSRRQRILQEAQYLKITILSNSLLDNVDTQYRPKGEKKQPFFWLFSCDKLSCYSHDRNNNCGRVNSATEGLACHNTYLVCIMARSVSQDNRINHFSTDTAFPSIKGAHKIIILLGIHPSFTFWTFHLLPP